MVEITISANAAREFKKKFFIKEINSKNKIIVFSKQTLDGKYNDNNSDTLFNISGNDQKYKGYWFQDKHDKHDFFGFFEKIESGSSSSKIIKLLKKGEKENTDTKFQQLWISLNSLKEI